MIPPGSCTMKLNAATEMEAVTWPEFAGLHPFAPVEDAAGILELIDQLSGWLCEITGYGLEEVLGKPSDLLWANRHDSASSEAVWAAVQKQGQWQGEIWIRRKDGLRRYIHGKVTAAEHGNITSYYITISDITGFAEREKALRERIDALQDLLH